MDQGLLHEWHPGVAPRNVPGPAGASANLSFLRYVRGFHLASMASRLRRGGRLRGFMHLNMKLLITRTSTVKRAVPKSRIGAGHPDPSGSQTAVLRGAFSSALAEVPRAKAQQKSPPAGFQLR